METEPDLFTLLLIARLCPGEHVEFPEEDTWVDTTEAPDA